MQQAGVPVYDLSQGISQYWLGRLGHGSDSPGCLRAFNWPTGNSTRLILNNDVGICTAAAVPTKHDALLGSGYLGDLGVSAIGVWVQYALIISPSLVTTSWINGVKVNTGAVVAVDAQAPFFMQDNSLGGPPFAAMQACSYLMYNRGHSDPNVVSVSKFQTQTYGIGFN
jgi:hypothetical protein